MAGTRVSPTAIMTLDEPTMIVGAWPIASKRSAAAGSIGLVCLNRPQAAPRFLNHRKRQIETALLQAWTFDALALANSPAMLTGG